MIFMQTHTRKLLSTTFFLSVFENVFRCRQDKMLFRDEEKDKTKKLNYYF